MAAGDLDTSFGGLAVARLNADGSPDATFGTAGETVVDIGQVAFGHAIALTPGGRIVAGRRPVSEDFAVTRLLADGGRVSEKG